MDSRRKYCVLNLTVGILVLLLGGCIFSDKAAVIPNTNTTEASVQKTEISTKIVTPEPKTLTATPLDTITPTITKRIPSITVSPIVLPTVNPTEKVLAVKKIIENNGGCDLPCWWGFQPGVSSWKDASPIVELLNEKIENTRTDDLTLIGALSSIKTNDGFIQLGQNYIVDNNGIIQYIMISAGRIYHVFPLQELLSKNGKPDEIWVMTYSTPFRDEPVPFNIYLFYHHQGFLAIYQFTDVKLDQQSVTACGKEITGTNFWLWKPEKFQTVMEANDFFTANLPFYAFKEIQQVSKFDPESFTEYFTNPKTDGCISTPKKYWHSNDGG